MAYKYKVYDKAGNSKVGEMSAGSLEEAEKKLQAQGDTVISIIPLLEKRAKAEKTRNQAPTGPKKKLFSSGKAKPSEVATTLRNLAVMSESGVPFYESLQAVGLGVESVQLRGGVDKISEAVLGGRTLGQSLRAAPEIFSPIVCDIVSVGEESGRLDNALASAANYMERAVALKGKLVNALIYPSILLGTAVMTVFALVFFIMPKFGETFKGMNIKPPLPTQILMDFGTTASERPWIFAVMFFSLWGFIFYAKRTPPVMAFVVRASRKMPMLGPVLRQLSVARMLQTLSSLMSGGVPLLTALEHSSKVAGDPDVLDATQQALADVESGGMLSESFRQSGVLPPTIVQMMAVGEKTGQMAKLISRAADEMESQADARLKSLMSIFEPLMILVMGGVIGLITFSLISPLFSVLSNVK